MVTFLPRIRALPLVIVAVVAAFTTWSRDERPAAPRHEVQPIPTIAAARGLYALEDGSLRVAIVDGCVAAAFATPTGMGSLVAPPTAVGSLVAPQLGTRCDLGDVVLVPSMLHIAIGGDGLVLAVAPDQTLTVFARLRGETRSHRTLPRATTSDPRDAWLLEAAGLSRRLQAPLDAAACASVGAWLDAAVHDDRRDVAAALLWTTTDRCLVPAIRRALDVPAASAPAGLALARLATAAEQAEALLAILDAADDGGAQAIGKLAQYLRVHLSPSASAELEREIRTRLVLDGSRRDRRSIEALHAYLGREAYTAAALELAATAPCPAIESLIATLHVSSIPPDRIVPALAPILDRAACAEARAIAAYQLAALLADRGDAPEGAWALLRAHLDAARDNVAGALSYGAGCYSATRDLHPTADAVLARLRVPRCSS